MYVCPQQRFSSVDRGGVRARMAHVRPYSTTRCPELLPSTPVHVECFHYTQGVPAPAPAPLPAPAPAPPAAAGTACSSAYINSICTHNIRPQQTVSADAVLCTTHVARTFCCICSGATPSFAASVDQSCSRMAFTAGTSGSSDASSSACRSKATSLRYTCPVATPTRQPSPTEHTCA